MVFGGDDYAIGPIPSELYNGSNWIVKTELNDPREHCGGCGISNNALAFGGYGAFDYYWDSTELYNGSNWTTQSDTINTPRYGLAGCGVANSALAFGGVKSSSSKYANTEFYNGSNWSNRANLNNAMYYLTGCGVSNSALTTHLNITELYDGNSWSIKNSLNTARYNSASCGTTNDALVFGGYQWKSDTEEDLYYANTELYNGLTWSNKNNLGTAREQLAGSGIPTNALAFNGMGPEYTNYAITEQYATTYYNPDLSTWPADNIGTLLSNVPLTIISL